MLRSASAFGAVHPARLAPGDITGDRRGPHFGAECLRLDSPLARHLELRSKHCRLLCRCGSFLAFRFQFLAQRCQSASRRGIAASRRPLPDPAPTASWNFLEPFGLQDVVELPFSESVVIPRHLRVSTLHCYLNLAPLRDLRDSTTPPPTPADETGRSAQIFMMDVVARKGTETRRVTAHGRDIYAFTAPLVVEAAQRILDGAVEKRGVFAPGSMFDALNFLQSLAPKYLTFETGS